MRRTIAKKNVFFFQRVILWFFPQSHSFFHTGHMHAQVEYESTENVIYKIHIPLSLLQAAAAGREGEQPCSKSAIRQIQNQSSRAGKQSSRLFFSCGLGSPGQHVCDTQTDVIGQRFGHLWPRPLLEGCGWLANRTDRTGGDNDSLCLMSPHSQTTESSMQLISKNEYLCALCYVWLHFKYRLFQTGGA